MNTIYRRPYLQVPECWWKWAQASRDAERVRYVHDLLHRLGWDSYTSLEQTPFMRSTETCSYLVSPFKGIGFYLAVVPQELLMYPSQIKHRYLDFCPISRLLCGEFSPDSTPFLLVTDFEKFHLYSLNANALIHWADYPAQFQIELAPLFFRNNIENGSLSELPMTPKSTYARELREWTLSWTKQIAEFTKIPEEKANQIIDRFIVIHHVFSNGLFWKTRDLLEERLLQLIDLTLREELPSGIGEALVSLFHDMWFDWRIEIFQIDPDIDQALANDEITAELLFEYPLLSPNKFDIPVLLESFNYGDALERMRIRMIPEPNPEREKYLQAQTYETIDQAQIEVDIATEGYRAVLFWFDRIMKCYDLLEETFLEKQQESDWIDSDDLWSWGNKTNNLPYAFRNKLQQVCNHGLRIYYQNARQLHIAQLLLTIHIIQLSGKSKCSLERFPSLAKLFIKTPDFVPSEKYLLKRA